MNQQLPTSCHQLCRLAGAGAIAENMPPSTGGLGTFAAIAWVALLAAAVLASALAQPAQAAGHAAAPRRSRRPPAVAPPKAFPAEIEALFLPDVAKTLGPSPAVVLDESQTPIDDGDEAMGHAPVATGANDTTLTPSAAASVGVEWSEWLAAETLEDEVKAEVTRLKLATELPGRFKSGGYRAAREASGWLAVLLGVVEEYRGSVRWQSVAGRFSVPLGRLASQCKVGSDASYRAAQEQTELLDGLLRGEGTPSTQAGEAAPARWAELVEREPLMPRLERGLRERIEPAVARDEDFAKRLPELRREAQVMRLLAIVVQDEGYEFAAEEAYVAAARSLFEASKQLQTAIEREDRGAAAEAAATASRACDDCHNGFR